MMGAEITGQMKNLSEQFRRKREDSRHRSKREMEAESNCDKQKSYIIGNFQVGMGTNRARSASDLRRGREVVVLRVVQPGKRWWIPMNVQK